ncbi:transcriptional coactivator/pterin dehydratase [Pseudovirgaria hyperparasitica]|uniref:4a-hydroxytetrahydrobiopterin dehydratase n=1 Tax=Pseudovirgaria hyperparasitica TaxID=470096 RepID=A0A6A6W0D0_9PEZI|nr:transcriptional coactivator/pterin dehydratase [Pseudovirgaria hyperparasitica]KAF2755965.1 transcriptional coactivator/pterin dehydratase [Pseudovirgaria hyperparasitica]
MDLQISSHSDRSKVLRDVEHLRSQGWEVKDNTLQKTFYFKTYTKVLDFHQVIGIKSKSMNHHSTMKSDYNSLTVVWTTHDPPGLSEKDTIMGEYCDEHSSAIGTIDKSKIRQCGSATPGL